MKKILFLLACVVIHTGIRAQFILREDLLNRLNAVPALPATAAASFSLCVVNDGHIKTGTTMQQLLNTTGQLLMKQATTADGPAPQVNGTQTQADLAKSMSDPAMQQKIAQMSDAEKLALAMQVQQQAGTAYTPQKPKAESPAAVESAKKLIQYEATEGNRVKTEVMNLDARWNALKQEMKTAHEAIDQEMKAALAALPTKGDGGGEEMVYANPESARQVIISHASRHIEKQNLFHTKLQALLSQYQALYSSYITYIDTETRVVDYGNQTSMYRTYYHQAQVTAIGHVLHLLQLTDEMTRIQASAALGLQKAQALNAQSIYQPIQLFEI